MASSFPIKQFLDCGYLIQLTPDRWMLGVGPIKKRSASSDLIRGDIYHPNFHDSDSPVWGRMAQVFCFNRIEISEIFSDNNKISEMTDKNWRFSEKREFQRQFEAIQQKIELGSLKKAVPIVCRKLNQKINPEYLQYWIIKSLEFSKSQFSYGVWNKGEGLFGCTPEVLFKRSGSALETVALAGTRSKDENYSLLEDPKQIQEHNFVIRSITEDLESFGEIKIGATIESEAGPLVHLKTPIYCDLKLNCSLEEIIRAMHPTPALGVYPKTGENLKFLKKISPSDRGGFGAPFGVCLDPENFFCLVAIRNVQWSKEEIRLFSGCGVVRASEFEAEWMELKHKAEAVKEMLDL